MSKDVYNIKDLYNLKDMSFEASFTMDEEGLRGLAAFLKEQDDEILDAIFNGKQGLILHDPKRGMVEVSCIVRCKNCKYWNKDTERNDGYGYCSYWQRFIAQAANEDIQTYKDVFCGYGERKE